MRFQHKVIRHHRRTAETNYSFFGDRRLTYRILVTSRPKKTHSHTPLGEYAWATPHAQRADPAGQASRSESHPANIQTTNATMTNFWARLTLRVWVVALIGFGSVVSGFAHEAGTTRNRGLDTQQVSRDEVRRFAAPLVDTERIDGLSIGVIQDQRRFTVHLGKATTVNDPKLGEVSKVADDDTVYEIGSISKVFTAILLAHAAIDDAEMLASSPNTDKSEVALPNWPGRSITWLDLAVHRSGLPRLPTNFETAGSVNPYASYDSKKAIEFLRDYKLQLTPGERFQYSNFAFSWLGYLLAQRGGTSYGQLLSDRVTNPLGMLDTSVALSLDQKHRFATPHQTFGRATSSWEFADLPGAGGIRSTTADMLKFMAAQLDPPDSKLGKSIDLAWKQHQPGDADSFAMGLGWHIARDGQTRFHNGQTGGFHSAMFVNREINTAVIVLANTASLQVDLLAELLIQKLAGVDVPPLTFPKPIQVDQ